VYIEILYTPEELTTCYENKSSSEQLKLEVNIKKYLLDRGYMRY